eukprot:TRINITY_DN20119_c0_g1_i1.p1 TRINITY_DN20119_c0_g1~~TRINITY_DN20119_c0_g1_i1.p1  ORF type:complete len:148 (-),score=26.37 TRINITY_DN20119_c0_g1_i1:240-683(-)
MSLIRRRFQDALATSEDTEYGDRTVLCDRRQETRTRRLARAINRGGSRTYSNQQFEEKLQAMIADEVEEMNSKICCPLREREWDADDDMAGIIRAAEQLFEHDQPSSASEAEDASHSFDLEGCGTFTFSNLFASRPGQSSRPLETRP